MKQIALDIGLPAGPTVTNFCAGPNAAALQHLELWVGAKNNTHNNTSTRSPVPTYLWGNSGSGKSSSLRHMDPVKTLIIQCIKKPLPFKSTGFHCGVPGHSRGNLIHQDNPELIQKLMRSSPHEVIVIDDYQAVMVNELMSRSSEKGYDKFTDIGKTPLLICTLLVVILVLFYSNNSAIKTAREDN